MGEGEEVDAVREPSGVESSSRQGWCLYCSCWGGVSTAAAVQ